jgi:hypothetical protein
MRCSGRSTTHGRGVELEFEHNEKKIDELTRTSVVLSSGDALLAIEVIERSKTKIVGLNNPTIADIATTVRTTYMQVHLERAEQLILHPRGLSFREFKEKGAQQIPLQIYVNIDNTLFNYGLNAVEFLIAGVDGTGAHIFRVHYAGLAGASWMEWCDKLGYRAIGSGALHASVLLAIEGQHRNLPIGNTLNTVYTAKRTSEVAPGVGVATDLAIIERSILSKSRRRRNFRAYEQWQRQPASRVLPGQGLGSWQYSDLLSQLADLDIQMAVAASAVGVATELALPGLLMPVTPPATNLELFPLPPAD